jgi:hypothetical protein
MGMLAPQTLQTLLFGLPRLLLRAVNGSHLRTIFLLTHLDAHLNLVADYVP